MKRIYFKTIEMFKEFIELCKKFSILFELPNKKYCVIDLPDDLTTDMFLLETGYGEYL